MQNKPLKVLEAKSANNVKLILMNPQNGEIYAMVNVPEFNLNEPFVLTDNMTEGVNLNSLSDFKSKIC